MRLNYVYAYTYVKSTNIAQTLTGKIYMWRWPRVKQENTSIRIILSGSRKAEGVRTGAKAAAIACVASAIPTVCKFLSFAFS